jgi:hypothetical protein
VVPDRALHLTDTVLDRPHHMPDPRPAASASTCRQPARGRGRAIRHDAGSAGWRPPRGRPVPIDAGLGGAERAKAATGLAPATQGLYRSADGRTNAEALAALSLDLHGLPEPGHLYEVGVRASDGQANQRFIGEFVGFVQDRARADAPHAEIALAFAIGILGQAPGARAEPLLLWPLDIGHLSLAQPGDSDPR